MPYFKHKATGERVFLRQLEKDIVLALDGGEKATVAQAATWVLLNQRCRLLRFLGPEEIKEYERE